MHRQLIFSHREIMNFSILYQNKMGGTDFLLQRLAAWLIENGFEEIDLTADQPKGCQIDVVILPASSIQHLIKLKKSGIKIKRILIWSLGYGALTGAFYNPNFKNILFGIPKKIFDYVIKKFIANLIQNNAIIFTDEPGLNFDLHGKSLSKINIDKIIVPIAINKYEPSVIEKKSTDITVGWVGRISNDFKTLPLEKLISDLNDSEKLSCKISKIIIIGDGDGAQHIEDHLKYNNKISYEIIKNIEPKELHAFIDLNIDILFAMGTSALDGANAGVATVITKPFHSISEEPKDSYRWIYNSKGYSLGELDSNVSIPAQDDVCINQLFTDVSRSEIKYHAEKSKNYCEDFYSDFAFNKIKIALESNRSQNIDSFYLYFLHILNYFKKSAKTIIRLLKAEK